MSRSFKKPYIKDKNNFNYNKTIRSRINNVVRMLKYNTELNIPNSKEIINDYDICDFKYEANKDWNNYYKYIRK